MADLRHDLETSANTERVDYIVTPFKRTGSALEPVILRAATGAVVLQDYLTPDQADALAEALRAAAQHARELNGAIAS